MNYVPKYIFIFLIACAFFTGCEKEDKCGCFEGTGKNVAMERPVEDVNTIYLNQNINLLLIQDTMCRLVITGGENVIKGIETNCENGILSIDNNNRCNWARSYSREINAILYVKKLNRIVYSGTGTIKTLNKIVTDSIRLDSWEGAGDIEIEVDAYQTMFNMHVGTSNIKVKGTSQKSLIYNASYGIVDCNNLIAPFALVTNKGTNNCFVNATGELIANIKYIGNIYYSGNPGIIEKNINGQGQVLPVE